MRFSSLLLSSGLLISRVGFFMPKKRITRRFQCPGNFVAMETRASLVLVCGVCVSVPRLDLHSKTLNTIAEMSCFIWVLRRISLIIADMFSL
jgi:hypothetical protein